MAKLLLLSVILLNIYLPIFMARDRHPRRGLYRTIRITAVYNVVYLFALFYVYPRLAF